MSRYTLRASNQNDLSECTQWILDGRSTINQNYYISTWRIPPLGQNSLLIPNQLPTCNVSLSVFNDDNHIGNIALSDVDFKCRCCDLSIIVKNDSDFKSSIFEVATLCFKTLGLNRIQLQTFFDSPISILCKKINLHLDSVLKEHGFENGTFKDIQIWSLINKEFDERFSDEL